MNRCDYFISESAKLMLHTILANQSPVHAYTQLFYLTQLYLDNKWCRDDRF